MFETDGKNLNMWWYCYVIYHVDRDRRLDFIMKIDIFKFFIIILSKCDKTNGSFTRKNVIIYMGFSFCKL